MDGHVLCVCREEDPGKQLLSRVIETSTRPFRHPSGDVGGAGYTNLEFWGAHGAGDLASVACEALGYMSPGMVHSGEEKARPEDQLTKALRPQSKDSDPQCWRRAWKHECRAVSQPRVRSKSSQTESPSWVHLEGWDCLHSCA